MTIQKPADQSIIFSGAMIQALIAGRKTETRRLAWDAKSHEEFDVISDKMIDNYTEQGLRVRQVRNKFEVDKPTRWQSIKPGTELWVRENFRVEMEPEHSLSVGQSEYWEPRVAYASDVNDLTRRVLSWKPSIHMPRKYSRLTLIVRKTYVEPVQSISKESCMAEGCPPDEPDAGGWYNPDHPHIWFRGLWNSINDSHPWSSNPDICAIVFSVEHRNIDAKEIA